VQGRKLDHVDTAVPESSSPDIFTTGEDSGELRVRSEEGFLSGKRFLIIDRDAIFSPRFKSILQGSGRGILKSGSTSAGFSSTIIGGRREPSGVDRIFGHYGPDLLTWLRSKPISPEIEISRRARRPRTPLLFEKCRIRGANSMRECPATDSVAGHSYVSNPWPTNKCVEQIVDL
jgi:hypothetical protein